MARNRNRRRGAGGGPVLLFGLHAVTAALANPRRDLKRLLATPEAADRHADALAAAARQGQRAPARESVDRATRESRLPPGAVHQGVAVEAAPLAGPALETVLARDGACRVLFLDRVTDPHNVGAIVRSAAAFGVAAVVVTDRHAPPETGVLAKAASGALEALPPTRVPNLARAVAAARAAGLWCLGLDDSAATPLAAAAPPARAGLVLGAEGPGLRRLTRESCDALVHLPTAPGMPSLNVSNAAAVALYEVVRSAPPTMP